MKHVTSPFSGFSSIFFNYLAYQKYYLSSIIEQITPNENI